LLIPHCSQIALVDSPHAHNPDKVIEILAKAGDAPFACYGQLSIYPDEKYTIRVVYDPLAGYYVVTAIED